MKMMQEEQIIIYQTEEGKSKIEIKLHDNMIWLTLNQIADATTEAGRAMSVRKSPAVIAMSAA